MDVKSLSVHIGVNLDQMAAGFKKADGLIQQHADKFQKAGKAVTATGAAIVGTLGLMVKNYVSAGDEVHKMSLRTGFSTEALSELKYAAEISGASIQSLETGVKKMSKSIVEGADGSAAYVEAFDRIGLSAKDLINLSPEEQFMKIAGAIADLESPTLRAATAQELFGKAGTDLLPLFAEGAAGMDALRQKARDMGLSISGPAAQGAADLSDAMTNLKGAFKGVTMTIGEQLAPTIEKIADLISGIVTKVKDWATEHPKLAKTILTVAGVVGTLCIALGPLLIMLPMLSAGFAMLWTAITGPIGIVIAAIAAVAAAVYLIIKYWEPIKEFFVKLWKDVSGFFVNAFNAIKKKLLDWSIAIVGILEKIPIVKKLAGPWKESLQSMRDEMDKTANNVKTATEIILTAGERVGFMWAKTAAESEGFANLMEAVNEKSGLLGKGLVLLRAGLLKLVKDLKQWGRMPGRS